MAYSMLWALMGSLCQAMQGCKGAWDVLRISTLKVQCNETSSKTIRSQNEIHACWKPCCQSAEEEMTEFLQPLLERLGGILSSRPSVDLQAGALSAISSAAAAAGSGFTPYARDALVLLRGFMEITEVGMRHALISA